MTTTFINDLQKAVDRFKAGGLGTVSMGGPRALILTHEGPLENDYEGAPFPEAVTKLVFENAMDILAAACRSAMSYVAENPDERTDYLEMPHMEEVLESILSEEHERRVEAEQNESEDDSDSV